MKTEQSSPVPTDTSSNQSYYAILGTILFAGIFSVIIWVVGPNLDPVLQTLLPDQGADWYFWKLPSREVLTMGIVWGFYLAHQITTWGLILWAQKAYRQQRANPSQHLNRYNYAMILVNLGFIVLHLVQTHLWFDGLAQDVPIWTSQGSVIIMLILILIIEHPRRGLILGKKINKPISAQVSGFFRRNHSYIIAWAIVYTFWFHPMTYDPQLITGFFYMFLLFGQISLAYTKAHVNRAWIVLLESFVGVHALVVAVFNTLQHGSVDMWAMFGSGFAFMFVFTYIYVFKLKREIIWGITGAYILGLLWIYLPSSLGGYGRSLANLLRLEFLWIPLILYGLAILSSGIVSVYLKWQNKKK